MSLFASRDDPAGRVRQICEAYREYNVGQIEVSLVLDLLDPAGEWTRSKIQIPATGQGPPPEADPITGCLPVTAR